jgi:hypothetical protein
MKKIVNIVMFSFLLLSLVSATVRIPSVRSASYFADLANPKTKTIVDAMNDYNLKYQIISNFNKIERHYADRIDFEFHLALGIIAEQKVGEFGILRWNYNGSEWPHVEYFIANINTLKYLLSLKQYPFSKDMAKRLDIYEKKAREFLYGKKPKNRWSVGLGFPMAQGTSATYAIIVAGYDISDTMMLSMGYTTENKLFGSLSMDLSTPFMNFAQNFMGFLHNWSGSGYPNNYMDNYDTEFYD